jgi:formiminotetrahydrofolate cyclodeaminase
VTLGIRCVIGALVGMMVVALVKIVSTISAKHARQQAQ